MLPGSEPNLHGCSRTQRATGSELNLAPRGPNRRKPAKTRLETQKAEIARTAGITRARVTQIINLTQLAPDIQEAILNLEPTTDHVPRFRERDVRTIAIVPNWEKQRMLWKRLVKRAG